MTITRIASVVSVVLVLLLSSALGPVQAQEGGPAAPMLSGTATDIHIYLPLAFNNYWRGYFDDFSDASSGWATGEAGYVAYGYLSGEYQLYLKEPWRGYLVTPDLVLPPEYRIEVDVRRVSPGSCGYGLIFSARWLTDSYTYYQAVVDHTYKEFLIERRNLDGSWTLIQDWTFSSAIGTGANHLRIDRTGSEVAFYINGTHVTTVYGSEIAGTGFDAGVRVYSYDTAPVDVRFDNFTVTLLD